MTDLLGESAALGELYLAVGPVVRVSGTTVTIAVGEGAACGGGKAVSLLEAKTLNISSLVTAVAANTTHAGKSHGIIYTFTVDEPATGVTSVTLLHNGKSLATVGDITLPVDCDADSIGITTYLDAGTAPTDWELELFKNGVSAGTAAVTFPSAGGFNYAALTWDPSVSFSAGDRFDVTLASSSGTDTADSPRAQITLNFTPT